MNDIHAALQIITPGTLMPEVPSFLFLRHGRTGHNHLRLMQGHMDVPLDEIGREQAKAAADTLHRHAAVTRIVSSDLARARDTAEEVGARLGIGVEPEPGLRERGFGSLEGSPIVPGVWASSDHGVEPLRAFADRIGQAILRHVTSTETLLVAHGGVFRVLCRLLGTTLPQAALSNALPLRLERRDEGWAVESVEPAALLPERSYELRSGQ